MCSLLFFLLNSDLRTNINETKHTRRRSDDTEEINSGRVRSFQSCYPAVTMSMSNLLVPQIVKLRMVDTCELRVKIRQMYTTEWREMASVYLCNVSTF